MLIKKKIIAFIAVLFLLLASVLSVGTYALGSNQGYSSGHTQGYQAGYAAGKRDGETDGYSRGKSDGYQAGYDANSNSGYEQGVSDTLGTIFDWQNSACTLYSNGYYQIKFWENYDRTIRYTCLVQSPF